MTTKKLILTLSLCLCLCHCRASATKVKLSDVKAITLTAGQFTTGRRSAPVLQQQCSGNFCNHAPSTIQCTNVGTDGLDIQWACEGDLPQWLSFKGSDVNCEGYDYPHDPYILAGSCGISYSLKGNAPFSGPNSVGEKVPGLGISFVIIVILILYCCTSQESRPHLRPHGTNAATAAAVGAAAGYAAGRSSGWGWGRSYGGYHRRRGRGRGGGGFRSSSRRTARAFSGTYRR